MVLMENLPPEQLEKSNEERDRLFIKWSRLIKQRWRDQKIKIKLMIYWKV